MLKFNHCAPVHEFELEHWNKPAMKWHLAVLLGNLNGSPPPKWPLSQNDWKTQHKKYYALWPPHTHALWPPHTQKATSTQPFTHIKHDKKYYVLWPPHTQKATSTQPFTHIKYDLKTPKWATSSPKGDFSFYHCFNSWKKLNEIMIVSIYVIL